LFESLIYKPVTRKKTVFNLNTKVPQARNTCVSDILVTMANIIFSFLDGYGFLLFLRSHSLSIPVDSFVAARLVVVWSTLKN